MLRTIAYCWGALFVLGGVMGFVPAATPDGHLLGVFHVNPAHNAVHILTGLAAIACGLISPRATRLYFRIFGLIYLLVAVLGFIYGERAILGIVANNTADVWLHTGIGLVSVILGWLPVHRPILKTDVNLGA